MWIGRLKTRNHWKSPWSCWVCILDVERGDRTWHWTQPRSRYHSLCSQGKLTTIQMLKVMKDYVIPHTYVMSLFCKNKPFSSGAKNIKYYQITTWPQSTSHSIAVNMSKENITSSDIMFCLAKNCFGATLKMNLGEYGAVILDSGMRAECGARFHSLIHNINFLGHTRNGRGVNNILINKQLASQWKMEAFSSDLRVLNYKSQVSSCEASPPAKQ